MARALLKERAMPVHFWGEAVTTTVFLLNRAPTKSLDGKTPYEAYHGQKPAVGFLKTFGCLGFTKHKRRGGNLGMGTQYSPGTRPDGYGYRDDFLPAGGTRTRPESRRVWDGYFSHPWVTQRVPDTLLPL
jgi:hypothetical protein